MPKYVIAEFSALGGIAQTIVKADSKLSALLTYFGATTDEDGHPYLDTESLVVDQGYEVDYDISIMKVGRKRIKTPWPFPDTKPE